MLVKRKEAIDLQAEQQIKYPAGRGAQPDITLRANCFLMVIFFVFIAMFLTIKSESIVRAGYELVLVKSQVAKIEKNNELLRLDIAKLKSPQRIQTIATTQLGMVLPQNVYCGSGASDVKKPTANRNGVQAVPGLSSGTENSRAD